MSNVSLKHPREEKKVVTESGMNGYNSMSTITMQSLTINILTESEKIAMLKLLPCTDNQPAGLTLIIT